MKHNNKPTIIGLLILAAFVCIGFGYTIGYNDGSSNQQPQATASVPNNEVGGFWMSPVDGIINEKFITTLGINEELINELILFDEVDSGILFEYDNNTNTYSLTIRDVPIITFSDN